MYFSYMIQSTFEYDLIKAETAVEISEELMKMTETKGPGRPKKGIDEDISIEPPNCA